MPNEIRPFVRQVTVKEQTKMPSIDKIYRAPYIKGVKAKIEKEDIRHPLHIGSRTASGVRGAIV